MNPRSLGSASPRGRKVGACVASRHGPLGPRLASRTMPHTFTPDIDLNAMPVPVSRPSELPQEIRVWELFFLPSLLFFIYIFFYS